MKSATQILAAALLFTSCFTTSYAQSNPPAETATSTPPKIYRLTYTVTEMDGKTNLGTQHFSMTLNSDDREANVKLGSRVPIATGSYNQNGTTGTGTQIQFQSVDVGLNISSRIHEYSTGVEVRSKLEQSSIAEEKSAVNGNDPMIRQATLQNAAY